MMKRIVLVILVLFITGNLYAGISVDPVAIEIVATKGAEKVGTVKICNTGEKTVQITVSPEKWASGDKDVATWLKFIPMEFTIDAGKSAEVSYRVTPPQDSIGELRCMVFFVADEVSDIPSNVGIRFGVPVYAVIRGTEVIDVEVSDIIVKYDSNEEVLSGQILVNNKSNIHIRPYIDMEVLDRKDGLVNRFSIPFGQPAQAGQNRPFMFRQNMELAPGKYKLVAKVDYGKMYGLTDRSAVGKKAFLVKHKSGEASEVKDEKKE